MNKTNAVQTVSPLDLKTVVKVNPKIKYSERIVLDQIFDRGEVQMGIHHYFTFIENKGKVAYSERKFISKTKEQIETSLISREEYYQKAHKLIGDVGRVKYNPEISPDTYYL